MNFYDVHLNPDCYIASNCTIIGSVSIDEKSSVFSGVQIRGDRGPITIGKNTNIQENTIMHVEEEYPCILGNNITVGHGAIIHGCVIKDNCLIGMGSIIMNGAVIGENSIIGAGAVVSENVVIPPNSIVVGIPGKVKRQIRDAELKHSIDSADEYSQTARDFTEVGFFLRGCDIPLSHPTIALAR